MRGPPPPGTPASTLTDNGLVFTTRFAHGGRTSRNALENQLLDGTPVVMLIDHLDVRVIHAATGEIIRTLTIDPNRRYHGTGRPPGAPKRPREPRQSGP
jgi:hypothetical protein